MSGRNGWLLVHVKDDLPSRQSIKYVLPKDIQEMLF